MAMPAVDERRWTVDEVHALPDVPGLRYEVVDGVLLVSAAPRHVHQIAQSLLAHILMDYVQRAHRALVLVAPMEYVLDPHTAVQPDISVFATPLGRAPTPEESHEPPVLFVEILSPSTARWDRGLKRERYQREGVEYWIVDTEARVIERWRSLDAEPDRQTTMLMWQLPAHPDAVTLDVAQYFARVWGEC